MLSPYAKDAMERITSTTAAAAVSAAAAYLGDLPKEWIPVGTVILETLRTLVAKWRGNPDNASLRM